MRIILLMTVLAIGPMNAQGQYTKAQVYDFTVGDVLQYQYMALNSGPPTTFTDTVVAKYYNSGMDTLSYVINRFSYTPPASMGASPIYAYTTDTLRYTNLSDLAEHLYYMSCLPPSDTMMVDACGVLFHRRHSNMDSTCFEPQVWYSDLYAGLGGPYYYVYDPVGGGAPGTWFSKTLMYYNSAQHGECGTFMSVAGMEHSLSTFDFQVFPNPAKDYVRLKAPSTDWHYTLYAMNGTLLRRAEVKQAEVELDIHELQPGLYFVKAGSAQQVSTLTLCVH